MKNKYKCTKCKDMMFIELEDGSFGSCECRKIRIAEDKLKASGVSEEFRKKRFENFNYENSIESMEAYVKTKNYSKNFNIIKLSNNNSIMLLGQVGSGKTHLAMAVSNIMLDNSIGVIYMPYRSVITRIKQSVTDEENYQKEVNIYKNAEVLLIDDLFKGRITEADINIIYEIVDYRYFKNLPMIITTEKTIEDLVEIDEAIGSRLYEKSKNYIIEMKGKKLNYRIYGD
ncbi:ATP-binding protein [Paraclostridium bifermentans]|uniref:ATP-binding protein n=1 Tax=Paraclostridium bifermentans TaxID=1490 RepID=UPI00359C27EF